MLSIHDYCLDWSVSLSAAFQDLASVLGRAAASIMTLRCHPVSHLHIHEGHARRHVVASLCSEGT